MSTNVSSPSRISQTFAELKAADRMAFMPFLTAGDPDLDMTKATIRELARQGVNLIEVGFPYSDPIADGPVIQASYTRALGKGIRISQIFKAIGELNDSEVPVPPLVGMVAYSIVFRTGVESFLEQAAKAGFSGLIIPDLPGDEAEDFVQLVRAHHLDLIELIAPTTPQKRAERILAAASGFVYCISVAGTTGVREDLPAELKEQLHWLRTKTKLPLAVGFGISHPKQVDMLRGAADGVIVGSALVKQFAAISEGSLTREEALKFIGEFAAAMVAKTSQSG
jgi:tryptophan synthase alpha chain